MMWYDIFQKTGDFTTCARFFTVKAVCQGVLRIAVCQGVQTASTDVFEVKYQIPGLG